MYVCMYVYMYVCMYERIQKYELFRSQYACHFPEE
jgi:hypothetical protein